jgi:hypothetical protein
MWVGEALHVRNEARRAIVVVVSIVMIMIVLAVILSLIVIAIGALTCVAGCGGEQCDRQGQRRRCQRGSVGRGRAGLLMCSHRRFPILDWCQSCLL